METAGGPLSIEEANLIVAQVKVLDPALVREHLIVLRAILIARGYRITQQRLASLAIRAYSADDAERDLEAAIPSAEPVA